MKMNLNFVSDGEPTKLANIQGDTLKDVTKEATEYLVEAGYLDEDDADEIKWEKGDVKGTYWLTIEDESTGLDMDFELERAK